jgi:hypothetical protein
MPPESTEFTVASAAATRNTLTKEGKIVSPFNLPGHVSARTMPAQ